MRAIKVNKGCFNTDLTNSSDLCKEKVVGVCPKCGQYYCKKHIELNNGLCSHFTEIQPLNEKPEEKLLRAVYN